MIVLCLCQTPIPFSFYTNRAQMDRGEGLLAWRCGEGAVSWSFFGCLRWYKNVQYGVFSRSSLVRRVPPPASFLSFLKSATPPPTPRLVI